nr:integrase, catalytic region, zinc finger, CCHC-type, peptidase aspartic, catalytic [Tanacetum cinerariifolium]
MKFKKDYLCSACEQGEIHRKHHKSKTAFASNKALYLLYMDLYGPMRVESINGKRYVLVVVDEYSRYTWVFSLHFKDEDSELRVQLTVAIRKPFTYISSAFDCNNVRNALCNARMNAYVDVNDLFVFDD